MERRSFLKHTGLAGILAAGSAPAIAQTPGEVKWRLASSFPKSLDTIFGGAEIISKIVAAATNNKFQIQVFAGGEIVPRVRRRRRRAERDRPVLPHGAVLLLRQGRDVRVRLRDSVRDERPQQNAWMYHGGGRQLYNDFLKEYNIVSFAAGNTGAQMGGWFRKEIKTVADLKGLKMRIGGTGGLPLAKLGVVPQQIPGGDIYPALEKGTIDAAEWVGPVRRRKARLLQGRQVLLLPGLVGRRARARPVRQHEGVVRSAEGLPSGP